MEASSITPETHQYFRMQDLDSNPARLLVEMNFLMEMFDLERVSEKDKPVVITLREKESHFAARQKRSEAR